MALSLAAETTATSATACSWRRLCSTPGKGWKVGSNAWIRRLQALFHSCKRRSARLPVRCSSICKLAVESSDAVATHAAMSSLPGMSTPRFFSRSNSSTTLSNREMPRVMVCRLISSHAAVMKSASLSSANTRISSGQNTMQCLMRTASMTQPSESMQTRNSRRLRKSANALPTAIPPLILPFYDSRFYQFNASDFGKNYKFYVSPNACPMGWLMSSVAAASAGVGCLLMMTRSSPRKYRMSPAAGYTARLVPPMMRVSA